ncbi:hypothetical protein D3C80_547290 [compost metagenome]
MRNGNGFELEGTDFETFASFEYRNWNFWRAKFRLALRFKQTGREWRRIDWCFQAWPKVEQRTVMVFVRMRNDDTAQIVLLGLEKTNVRQDQIRAGMFRSGKAYAHVDHDPFTIVFRTKAIHGEVHADFADTAERQEDKLRRW